MNSMKSMVIAGLLVASSAFAQESRELKTVVGTDGRAISCNAVNQGARGFIVTSAKVKNLASGNLSLNVKVQAMDCVKAKSGKPGFVEVDMDSSSTQLTPAGSGESIKIETEYKNNEVVVINENYDILSVEKYGNGNVSIEIAKPTTGFVDLFVRGTQTTVAPAVNYQLSEPYSSGLIRLVLK